MLPAVRSLTVTGDSVGERGFQKWNRNRGRAICMVRVGLHFTRPNSDLYYGGLLKIRVESNPFYIVSFIFN